MTAFTLFGLEVKWYGVLVALGFITAIIFSCIKLYKYKISIDPFYYFCLIGIPCAIIGARLGSVIIGQTPFVEFFEFRNGGLSILYGVLLTVLAAIIYFPIVLNNPKYMIRDNNGIKPVVRKISMLLYLDASVPTILIGHAIGRWGNYFNQEVTGPIVKSEWLIKLLDNVLPLMRIDGQVYHPFFLYEFFFNICGFVLIYFIIERIKLRKCGDLAYCYFIWYGLVRLCLEPFRQNANGTIGNLTTTILWLVAGITLIILNHTLFQKLRKYRIYYFLWNEIKIFFISLWSKISRNEKTKEHLKYLKTSRNNYKLLDDELNYYLGM